MLCLSSGCDDRSRYSLSWWIRAKTKPGPYLGGAIRMACEVTGNSAAMASPDCLCSFIDQQIWALFTSHFFLLHIILFFNQVFSLMIYADRSEDDKVFYPRFLTVKIKKLIKLLNKNYYFGWRKTKMWILKISFAWKSSVVVGYLLTQFAKKNMISHYRAISRINCEN